MISYARVGRKLWSDLTKEEQDATKGDRLGKELWNELEEDLHIRFYVIGARAPVQLAVKLPDHKFTPIPAHQPTPIPTLPKPDPPPQPTPPREEDVQRVIALLVAELANEVVAELANETVTQELAAEAARQMMANEAVEKVMEELEFVEEMIEEAKAYLPAEILAPRKAAAITAGDGEAAI